jgi:hypothetical protein
MVISQICLQLALGGCSWLLVIVNGFVSTVYLLPAGVINQEVCVFICVDVRNDILCFVVC